MKVLITGGAGFIGATLGQRLLEQGDTVVAIDNLNDYYEVSLKQARLARLTQHAQFEFEKIDIVDASAMQALFDRQRFDVVVHLAARAGVRHSILYPAAYIDSNLRGFGHILEGCQRRDVGHLVYASSSSVYGGNAKLPFAESDPVDHPVSLYAATKRANELIAHSYAHLHDLPCTGLRFFTVYGPWGRPDMAFFKFTRLILAGQPIPVYNQGQLTRDFTYIDDVVEGIRRVMAKPAMAEAEFDRLNPQVASSTARFKVYNIGNGGRMALLDCIRALEDALGVKAQYEMLPMQAGDVHATNADMRAFQHDFGFTPTTELRHGLKKFVEWYREYYAA